MQHIFEREVHIFMQTIIIIHHTQKRMATSIINTGDETMSNDRINFSKLMKGGVRTS
jgi:hypothetical protein